MPHSQTRTSTNSLSLPGNSQDRDSNARQNTIRSCNAPRIQCGFYYTVSKKSRVLRKVGTEFAGGQGLMV